MANSRIKAIGELGVRVADLELMKAFYRDVVGLDVYNEDDPGLIFFKVADADDGHPQLFALFDRPRSDDGERKTLDHFAFLIDVADYDWHKERLEAAGLAVFPKTFPHHGWRSLFFADPEGNTVEFVSADPSVR